MQLWETGGKPCLRLGRALLMDKLQRLQVGFCYVGLLRLPGLPCLLPMAWLCCSIDGREG
jgi:hypothetical protein